MMETIKVNGQLKADEKECLLHYDPIDDVWTMDSTVPKIFRRAIKQGWKPIRRYVYEDGTVCGMALSAPYRAVTIRSATKKQMSEKQLKNLTSNE